jgi:hypothetical protein
MVGPGQPNCHALHPEGSPDCVICFGCLANYADSDIYISHLHQSAKRGNVERLFALVRLILIPIGILNLASGIVGGIWLAVLGQWRILVFGVVALFLANRGLITIACFPGILFSAPLVYAVNKGKYVTATACAFLSHLWTSVVMTAWCVGIFYVVLAGYTGGSIWPFLLWAYNTAAGQWAYMAWVTDQASDHQSTTSTLAAIGACMGGIGLMGVFLFNPSPPIFDSLVAFSIPILAVLVAEIPLVYMLLRKQAVMEASAAGTQ